MQLQRNICVRCCDREEPMRGREKIGKIFTRSRGIFPDQLNMRFINARNLITSSLITLREAKKFAAMRERHAA
jgi:hypothetical protein